MLLVYMLLVYLRIKAGTRGMNTATIITAKSRVAPLKTLTISRLELLAALLLSRLIHSVTSALKDEIQPDPPVCFTDSKITLCWIQHIGKEWKQFVENRVSEIRGLVSPNSWYHSPGIHNQRTCHLEGCAPQSLKKSRSSGYKDQIGLENHCVWKVMMKT